MCPAVFVGDALQSGDIGKAQQALASLQQAARGHHHHHHGGGQKPDAQTASPVTTATPSGQDLGTGTTVDVTA